MIDYDISNWNATPVEYLEYFKKNGKHKIKSIMGLSYDCLRLYSMFKCLGVGPNGIYTSLKKGMALDNVIWWDFVFENSDGFVHIVRTCKQLEVAYYHRDDNFNIHIFFQENLKKYAEEIDNQILQFEKHIVYINHYKSYSNSVSNLVKEISEIELNEPTGIKGHVATKEVIESYAKDLESYTNNLIVFHPKAKSLLLNTAFKVEAFINIIIRIAVKRELLNYPDVLKKYLNYTFKDKLENIKFYTRFFKQNIDIDLQVVKDVLELMSIRNKYIHSDENSKINIIGEEYFDGEFPLFKITKKNFQIDLLNKTYLNPSKENIDRYVKVANEFENYIYSLIDEKYIEAIKSLTQINPLSYNTKRNIYSSIFPNTLMEFHLSLSDKK